MIIYRFPPSPRGARLRARNRAVALVAGSLVARGTCVLAEFTTTSGNFTTITRRILEKIPRADTSMSYVYDRCAWYGHTLPRAPRSSSTYDRPFRRHVFHYVVHEGLVFLCMADQGFGNQIPFSFLEDIMRRWLDAYGERGQTALAYGMNEDFSRVLQRQMDFYSRDKGVERMSRVRGEIDEVKAVMVENIEKVLERGEKIELLVDKSENLNQQAFKFKKQSTALRRAMWCKNVKMMLLIGFGIAVSAPRPLPRVLPCARGRSHHAPRVRRWWFSSS